MVGSTASNMILEALKPDSPLGGDETKAFVKDFDDKTVTLDFFEDGTERIFEASVFEFLKPLFKGKHIVITTKTSPGSFYLKVDEKEESKIKQKLRYWWIGKF